MQLDERAQSTGRALQHDGGTCLIRCRLEEEFGALASSLPFPIHSDQERTCGPKSNARLPESLLGNESRRFADELSVEHRARNPGYRATPIVVAAAPQRGRATADTRNIAEAHPAPTYWKFGTGDRLDSQLFKEPLRWFVIGVL